MGLGRRRPDKANSSQILHKKWADREGDGNAKRGEDFVGSIGHHKCAGTSHQLGLQNLLANAPRLHKSHHIKAAVGEKRSQQVRVESLPAKMIRFENMFGSSEKSIALNLEKK